MFERMVVGVSKAESAREAARHAVGLAQKFDAVLHLVIAFDGTDSGPQSASRRHAEGTVEAIAASCSGKHFNPPPPDDPATAILGVADEVDADLIVVGNRGMRGV